MFKKITASVLAFLMVFTIVSAQEIELPQKKLSIEAILAEQTNDHISQYYKFGVTKEELYRNALTAVLVEHPELIDTVMNAMLDNLDDYSEYLTDHELHSFADNLAGSFVGIGVTIEEFDGYIRVIAPIKGSPAEAAGIKSGDLIVSVNGENIVGKGVEYVQSLILGAEGTPVNVGVLRDNSDTEITYTIVRAYVQQYSVYPSVIDGNIGYLQITQFALPTPGETKKALDSFRASGVKKIIIDLRNNPGGDKDALVDMLKMFMPKGAVFRVNYKDDKLNEVYYSSTKPLYSTKDLVILINENSASAAEAFSGSMQDAGYKVIGMTSYGKGTVQMITPTIIGSGVKLTIATYATAKGREINKKGVTPDAMLKNQVVPLDENPKVEKIAYSMEVTASSEPAAIKAMQQRLYALGYYRGETDGVFTDALSKAALQFQIDTGLEATGKLDIMTQVEIANFTAELETVIDHQLEAAKEILKTGVIPQDLRTN